MRRLLPQTLPAWTLLILIAGLLTMQCATLLIVWRDRTENNKMLELLALSERANSLVSLIGPAAPDERAQLADGLSNHARTVTISDKPVVTAPIAPDDTLAELEDVLVARLGRFHVVDARIRREKSRAADEPSPTATDPDAGRVERELANLVAESRSSDRLTTSIEFGDGQWLNFAIPLTREDPILTPETAPLYAAVAILVIALSIWGIRRLTAPYRAMERAVAAMGDSIKSPPISEAGSREYRSAARALNAMQARLKAYVSEREHLAAALAHDLRTPLTRIRLRLELIGNERHRRAIAHDLDELESITRSVVDFTTLEVVEEKPEKVDLWSLTTAIADEHPRAVFEEESLSGAGLICLAQPTALRRCVTNLIENAIAYGERAHLTLSEAGDWLILTIRDEGPGIPADRIDSVFEPFERVEASRNRSHGGLGLGLTIARNAARRCGGDVRLANDPAGGLRAELRLPKASGDGRVAA